MLRHGDKASDHAPADLEAWEPVAGPNIGENDLGWNKHDTICHIEIRLKACGYRQLETVATPQTAVTNSLVELISD